MRHFLFFILKNPLPNFLEEILRLETCELVLLISAMINYNFLKLQKQFQGRISVYCSACFLIKSCFLDFFFKKKIRFSNLKNNLNNIHEIK